MTTVKKSIYEKLSEIQKTLNAPKSRFNGFGKYAYRSCEDILNAVKKHFDGSLTITISDEMMLVGNRHYVKATAVFSDGDSRIEATAFAREPELKKGMDEAQITGATSSYARKYALNGLFAIDDAKDADSNENNSSQVVAMIDENEVAILEEYFEALQVNKPEFLKYMRIESLQDMTKADYPKAITALKTKAQKAGKK